jgi:hypothetical protein
MRVRVARNHFWLVSYFYQQLQSCCIPTDYTTLKFSDEFNTDGAPDPTKWGYDLGAGGWGNAEVHTNAADNVIVAG